MIDLNEFPPKSQKTGETKNKKSNKLQRSPAQSAASRRNGATSHGPKTQAGKDISKLNAIKHGLCGEFILLTGESTSAYNEAHRQFMNRFQPQDGPEYCLVDGLCEITWELARCGAAKRNHMLVAMDDHRDRFDREFINAHYSVRISESYRTQLESGAALDNVERHMARLERSYSRRMKQLIELRKHFPLPPDVTDNPQIQNERNEPENSVTHMESTASSQAQPEPQTRRVARARYQPAFGSALYALLPPETPETETAPPETASETAPKVRSAAA